MAPFFTIITSTWNAAGTLSRLLDSLAAQTCRDFNWIVQDGASSDATLEIVEQYRDRLPEILADSGRDNGIYDAWNKAIARWQDKLGDWVLFLGADDRLAGPDVLRQVQQKIQNCESEKEFACGHMLLIDMVTGDEIKRIKGRARVFDKRYRGMFIPHGAFFARRHFFQPPCFDTHFRIAGDYDFILQHWTRESQFFELNMDVTEMGNGGISSTQSLLKEDFLVIKKNRSLFCAVTYLVRRYLEKVKAAIKPLFLGLPCGSSLYAAYRRIRRLDDE